MHKFEKLEVWRLSIAYVDRCYALAEALPKGEEFNLASQLRRAAVSISLNIAEGSTSQSDPEQSRFLNMSIRSVIETVACHHLIYRRRYFEDLDLLRNAYRASEELVAKLQALRRSLISGHRLREDTAEYELNPETPFDAPL